MIIDDQELKRISQAWPVLRDATSQLARHFHPVAFLAKIPTGHDVFLQGDDVDAIACLGIHVTTQIGMLVSALHER